MEKVNPKLDGKILFWAVLGPFLSLLTLFVCVAKASSYVLPMALVTLIGIPICWRWRMRGLLFALGALGVVLAGSFGSLPSQHHFWQVGVALAFAMSLVVTALSFEEVEALVGQLQKELQSRLESLWRLDEKVKNVQERWQYDREDFSVRLKMLSQELEEKQVMLNGRADAIAAAKEEMERLAEQRDLLAADLLTEQQRSAALAYQVEDLKNTPAPVQVVETPSVTESHVEQEPVLVQNEETERELRKVQGLYRQLREQFEDKDRVLHEARVALFEKENALLTLQRDYEEAEKGGFLSAEKLLQDSLDKAEKRCVEQEEEIEALNDLVSSLMENATRSSASTA